MGASLCTRPKTPRRTDESPSNAGKCGTVGSIFFEPETPLTDGSWTYVGNGKGEYKKVQAFNFRPGGSYERDDDPDARPLRLKCIVCLIVAAVIVVLAAFFFDKNGDLKDLIQQSASIFNGDAGEAGYDCQVDADGGPSAWTSTHRAWCCRAQQVLCSSDCDAGSEDAIRAWSSHKKAWCCQDQHIGCEPTAPRQDLRPHGSGRSDEACAKSCMHGGQTASCQDRVAWLARNRYRGQSSACSRAIKTVTQVCSDCAVCQLHGDDCEEYDCKADLFHWQHTWPSDKQHWCCQHKGKGCAFPLDSEGEPRAPGSARGNETSPAGPLAALPMPFHCGVGLSTWSWSWSDAKKQWCCKSQGIACLDDLQQAVLK